MLVFREVSAFSADATALMEELSAVLTALVGHDGATHVRLEEYDAPGGTFLVGYLDGVPACCAGIRQMDESTGELKRVYARANKIGMGQSLLEALEQWAADYGYSRLVLECREANAHAIDFYRRHGYRDCEKYEPYLDQDDAVCLEKVIG